MWDFYRAHTEGGLCFSPFISQGLVREGKDTNITMGNLSGSFSFSEENLKFMDYVRQDYILKRCPRSGHNSNLAK
jgi:hypothetical protein